MALDATVGGVNANSYISVADADAYFELSAGSASWLAILDVANKEALLIEATRLLDLYFVWNGEKTSSEQALGWPRKNAVYPDGSDIPESVIPKAVKYATCDLAFSILSNSGFRMDDNNLDMVKVGSITVDFIDSKSTSSMPKTVLTYLSAYGQSSIPYSNGINAVRLRRS